MQQSGVITQLLQRAADGDLVAENDCYGLLYHDFRRLAAAVLREDWNAHSFHPTELVHQTLLSKMYRRIPRVQSRYQFLSIFRRAAHQIMVDRGRRRITRQRFILSADSRVEMEMPDDNSVALERAFGQLAKFDPQVAAVVRAKLLEGRTWPDTAARLGIPDHKAREMCAWGIQWLRLRVSGS